MYGYSQNPESTRLGEFAKYDWTDPVAVEGYRRERELYHQQNDGIIKIVMEKKERGDSIESIASEVIRIRNENRLASYAGDEKRLESVKKSNLDKYGNENGMTLEYALKKYCNYEAIIKAALRTNPGMDACCGLYDKYF